MGADNVYPWPINNQVYAAGEALAESIVVQTEGTTTVTCGSTALTTATNQDTTMVEIPLGVTVLGATASGTVPNVVSQAGSMVLITVGGSDGVLDGELCVVETNTGFILGVDSTSVSEAAADWFVGHVRRAADAGALALVELNIVKKEA